VTLKRLFRRLHTPLAALAGAKANPSTTIAERDASTGRRSGEMLSIQAAPCLSQAGPFPRHGCTHPWQREFEGSFIYDTQTPDQMRRIVEYQRRDMERHKPMVAHLISESRLRPTESRVFARLARPSWMASKLPLKLVPEYRPRPENCQYLPRGPARWRLLFPIVRWMLPVFPYPFSYPLCAPLSPRRLLRPSFISILAAWPPHPAVLDPFHVHSGIIGWLTSCVYSPSNDLGPGR